MDLENLNVSPELKEKVKACKTPEDLLALAKKEGYKLSDAAMEVVTGGCCMTADLQKLLETLGLDKVFETPR